MNFLKILITFIISINIYSIDVELVARADSYGSFKMPYTSYVLNSTIKNNGNNSIAFSFTTVIEEKALMGLWVRNSNYPDGKAIFLSNEEDYIDNPSINEKGDIVFTVYNELNVVGVYLYKFKTNKLELVLDDKQTAKYQSVRSPEINNQGTILFRAVFKTGEKAVLTLKKDVLTTVATDKDPDVAYLFGASFYDGNNIVLKVREGDSLSETQPDTIRIYKKNGNFVRLNSDRDFDSDSIFTHFNNSIGSHFTSKYISFVAKLSNGKKVLVRQLDENYEIIAQEGQGGISTLEYFAPAINEKGHIAFRAINASKKRSIFLYDGFVNREVLSEGELISSDQSTAVIHSSNGPAFGGGLSINKDDHIVLQAKIFTKYKEEGLGTAILKVIP